MNRLSKLCLSLALTTLCAACANGPGSMSSSSAVKASGTSAAAASMPGASLDKDGYIHNWLVLAPINFGAAYNAEDIDKDQIPNEGNLTPKAGDKQTVKSEETVGNAPKMVDKQLTWQPVTTADHVLDFNEILKLDSSENIGAYAVAYLDAPEEMKDITFSLSSNDDGKIFLNGKSIWTYVGGRALEEDSDKVDGLTLKKGSNVLIFKVWNDSSNWQACLRILDKAGKPVKM